MNQVSITTSSTKPIWHIEPDLSLTTLPADVLPNIFNRLSPATDFFGLACTSKEVHCLVQPYLLDLATRLLDNFLLDNLNPNSLETSIHRLARLFRTGCLHNSDQAWLDILKRAGDEGIDREMIEILLFSFAADDTKHPTLPKPKVTAAVAYPVMFPLEEDHSAGNRQFAMGVICREGVAEMMRAERRNTDLAAKSRQLSLRPGWKGLVEIFRQLKIRS